MTKKLIAANWKMNLLRSEATVLVNSLIENNEAEFSLNASFSFTFYQIFGF